MIADEVEPDACKVGANKDVSLGILYKLAQAVWGERFTDSEKHAVRTGLIPLWALCRDLNKNQKHTKYDMFPLEVGQRLCSAYISIAKEEQNKRV